MNKVQSPAVGPGRTRLVLTRKPGQTLLVGDTLITFDTKHKVCIYAPESTSVIRGECLQTDDVEQLQRIADLSPAPYRVDVLPGTFFRELADAAQVAECKHRPGKPATVFDKYGKSAYVSKGGPDGDDE